uniref:Uncharacterized protein n=1 Tax=Panagrolaimus sp. PS1159 TaxID=55785 RepID=A0AC35GF85_9BILA
MQPITNNDNSNYEIVKKRPRMNYYNTNGYQPPPLHHQPTYNPLLSNPYEYSLQHPSTSFITTTWLTPQKMKEYLGNEKFFECIMYLFFPCCFQKSYKCEKRLMCPPPALILTGNGWNNLIAQPTSSSSSSMNGNNGLIAMMKICNTKEAVEETMEKSTVNIPNIVALFRAKNLYINSIENKKLCRLSVDLHFSNGEKIEKINSGRIKVISKPSKKSQKDTGNDGPLTAFKNGSQIALYNRFRQANSTRYLHCHSKKFFGSISQWSVFKIYLVDEDAKDDTLTFETNDESICYKSRVKLVDVATEISLPIMRIRKVAKEAKEDIYKPTDKYDEPVSQLHMIAFEHIDINGKLSYLSVSSNETIIWQTISDLNTGINEGARWTITSAERYVYRFYPVNGMKKFSMLNFPVVFDVIKAEHDKIKKLEWLEIRGTGFDRSTKVWFNTCPSPQTIYRSAKTLLCVIPSTREYCANCNLLGIQITNNDIIPLYLTNEDGNIYPTSFVFMYNKNIQGSLGHAKFIHEQDRNTIIQPVNVQQHHQNYYPSQMGIIH